MSNVPATEQSSPGATALRTPRGVLIALAVCAAVAVVIGTTTGDAPRWVQVGIIGVSLIGVALASYLVWHDRWNVPAHMVLAFTVPSYVIPVFFLNTFDAFEDGVIDTYARVMGVGFMCVVAGTLLGGMLAHRTGTIELPRLTRCFDGDRAMRTVALLAIVSVVGLSVCFLSMGTVPALADDPAAARFLRGPYNLPPEVKIVYRASTAVITVLIPILALTAFSRRSAAWVVLLGLIVGMMLLTLQRGPAASGLLLAIGVLFAYYRWPLVIYFGMVLVAYTAGSAMFSVLASLGFTQFGSASDTNVLKVIASGAPDVTDHLTFLSKWLDNPEHTYGRTFFGGVIPGNFEWNPAVWTLNVLNPEAAVTDIPSGGLRLPAPMWGYVSFGWPGVVLVSVLAGTMLGTLAVIVRAIVAQVRLLGSLAFVFVVYLIFIDVLGTFYTMSYIALVQLATMTLILGLGYQKHVKRQLYQRGIGRRSLPDGSDF